MRDCGLARIHVRTTLERHGAYWQADNMMNFAWFTLDRLRQLHEEPTDVDNAFVGASPSGPRWRCAVGAPGPQGGSRIGLSRVTARAANLKAHGLDFVDAAFVFEDVTFLLQ